MRQPRQSKPAEKHEIIQFPEGTSPSTIQMQMLIETLTETNAHLKAIAGIGTDTLGFIRKWVPWMIAAAGVLYPTVGKVISGLPPLPT